MKISRRDATLGGLGLLASTLGAPFGGSPAEAAFDGIRGVGDLDPRTVGWLHPVLEVAVER